MTIHKTIAALIVATISACAIPAQAQQAFDSTDPATRDQLDAYMQQWLDENAGRVFEAVQKHLAEEEQARQPKLADFEGKLDQLLAANAPHEGVPIAEADIVFVEFFDYNCPYCQALHKEVRNLQADPNITGVAYIYRDLPILDPTTSFAAAYAGHAAAAQGKYNVYSDLLWSLPSHNFTEQMLVDKAAEAGLDMQRFEEDRSSEATKNAVAESLELGRSLKIAGTPFVFLWSTKAERGLLLNGYTDAENLKSAIKTLQSGDETP